VLLLFEYKAISVAVINERDIKMISPKNQKVTPTEEICTESSICIFFSTTDKVEFTWPESVLLNNCVEATIAASAIVKNAAARRFEGHLDKLDLYFGSSSPETLNYVTEAVNKIHDVLTNNARCLTFFNITKPKHNSEDDYKWPQFTKIQNKTVAEETGGSSDIEIMMGAGGIDESQHVLSKLLVPSSEDMVAFHYQKSKRWIETQRGVNVNIDLDLLTTASQPENAIQLIYRAVAIAELELDDLPSQEVLDGLGGDVISDLKILVVAMPLFAFSILVAGAHLSLFLLSH
jgi:hypothetical protein